MSESAVSFSHTVHILFSLESTTLVIESVYDFGSKLVGHSFSTALACILDKIFH